MQSEKLSISLPADMVRMIRRQVDEGAYASTSDVIREALTMWQSRDTEHLDRLSAIRSSLEDAAADPRRFSAGEIADHFDRLLERADTSEP